MNNHNNLRPAFNRHSKSRGLSTLKKVAFGLSLSVSTLGFAEGDTKQAPGEADYMTYCASCHGKTGEGNGPVANHLKNRPPDLTYITQQQTGGEFPYMYVLGIVEGNSELDKKGRTHGPSDMPVWGNIIYEDSGERSSLAKARLRQLVDYIKNMQR